MKGWFCYFFSVRFLSLLFSFWPEPEKFFELNRKYVYYKNIYYTRSSGLQLVCGKEYFKIFLLQFSVDTPFSKQQQQKTTSIHQGFETFA